MSTNKKHQKPIFKFVVMPKSIFLQAPRPNRTTAIIIALILLLIIVILIASNEAELRTKSLELVISIIEAIVTFLGANLKNK